MSATLPPASPIARLKSSAEDEAISRIGSKRLDFIMGQALSAGCRGLRRELRHELLKVCVATVDSHRFIHVLTQEFDDFRPLLPPHIHPRLGPAPIGPNPH